ncbi:helix-turn-helix domain-containing protein [uncultured Bacteroides sp.]|uniref:helix-turn-helix domain-containing protein n=1 Tax=uncultured Bacteroides sp. TaxID=162156 RepID=UPI00260FDB2C|nr:helix-turn-helix domain-containing protein [uncultured Bacteroides sp.]
MNKKYIIIELYKTGFSTSEIAEQLGVTEKYARKIIATCTDMLSTELTERNYVKAIKHGFESKEELASHFGVSYRTLKRFEESTGINLRLAKYLYVQGKTDSEITTLLHTKTSVLNIHEAGTLPTIVGIKSDLETVLGILKEYAQIDDETQSQYYALKRIYEKL